MSVQIMRHTIMMVLGNLTDALKASILPFLIAIAITVAVFAIVGLNMDVIVSGPMTGNTMPEQSAGALLGILLLIPVYLFVFAWVAVTWHRFVLLEEYPGILPQIGDRPIWPYVGKSLMLAIIFILIAIPLGIVVGIVASPFMALSPFLAGSVVAIVMGLIVSYLWLRWALILPSTALGTNMTMSESWQASSRVSRTILGVSFLLILMNFVLSQIAVLIGANIVGLIISLIVNWFTLMVGISILTTLYGHLVENRELAP